MRILACAAMPLALAAGGCANPPPAYLGAAELRALVVSRTLTMPPADGWPYATQLYLDSRGTGWMNTRVDPIRLPWPGTMTAVLSWQVFDPGWVCAWTTPTLGDVQSNVQPRRECLQVFRSAAVPEGLEAVAARGRGTVVAPLDFVDGNAFPPMLLARFDAQLRVLFGGQIPVWEVPPTYPPLDERAIGHPVSQQP